MKLNQREFWTIMQYLLHEYLYTIAIFIILFKKRKKIKFNPKVT